ncbi:MAG TPA: DUF2568 domain-containing protein [Candidatus Limnocylindrales bacterium]|jgi:hypothetical protein
MLASANVALRFILELAALVAAFVVGSALAPGAWSIPAGVAAAAVFAVVWGLWLAPRARFPQPAPVRLLLGTALMELVAVALALTAAPAAGWILAVLVLVNAVALAVLPTPAWAAEPDRVGR